MNRQGNEYLRENLGDMEDRSRHDNLSIPRWLKKKLKMRDGNRLNRY